MEGADTLVISRFMNATATPRDTPTMICPQEYTHSDINTGTHSQVFVFL